MPSFCALHAGATHAFVTDYADPVLENCLQNARQNAAFLGPDGVERRLAVRRLDWRRPFQAEETASRFAWAAADLAELDRTQVLLAADVLYDDDITDGAGRPRFFSLFHFVPEIAIAVSS